MSHSYPHIISRRPRIIAETDSDGLLRDGIITSLTIGAGRLSVHAEASLFKPKHIRAGLLAITGRSSGQIGTRLDTPEQTIKTHIKHVYRTANEILQDKDPYAPLLTNRCHLIGFLLTEGICAVEDRAAPLLLTAGDRRIVPGIIRGDSEAEMAVTYGVAPSTIHTHLSHIMEVNPWHTREEVALAGLMSGEFALPDLFGQIQKPAELALSA